MAFKDRWLNAIKRGQDKGYKAARKVGFDVGYATTTAKKEIAYAASKAAKAISSTKVAQNFVSGYCDGRDEAEYAFMQRCERREEKARAKYEAKAAREAANELFDEFDIEEFE